MRTVIAVLELFVICEGIAAAAQPIAVVPPMAVQWSVYTPQPEYPVQARENRITGSGIFALHVNLKSGLIERLDIEKSTGNRVLDTSAIKALKQWRFNAAAMRRFRDKADPTGRARDMRILIPVRFVM